MEVSRETLPEAGMNYPAKLLNIVEVIVSQYDLASLQPTLRACQALAEGGPIDLAVIGQFKSGKSSLLNAVLGEDLLPVGVLPATAVITRVAAANEPRVLVTFEDRSSQETTVDRIADFATEAGNPENRRHVAVVDVFTPTLRAWPGVRLVDTPGLGSVFAHNTATTRTWMPNIAVALVTVSAERPLSDQDRQLIAEALETAPRVVLLLTKMDLLTESEMTEVTDFVRQRLNELFGTSIQVLPFSTRVAPEKSVGVLRETILRPIAENVAARRRDALAMKMAHLVTGTRSYLSISLGAAQRADVDRNQLLKAVFTESVQASLIRDELQLAKERICGGIRDAFRRFFFAHRSEIECRIEEGLRSALPTWVGNLASQARRYQAWMSERLTAELTPLSQTAVPMASEFVQQADARFSRIVEAFRDRLSRNIKESMDLNIAPVTWEATRPQLTVIPVSLGQTFMTHWELLWWMLPMRLIGVLFRRHVLRRVSWEFEKNLFRLTSDWTMLVESAIDGLRAQAADWVDAELVTLRRLLEKSRGEAASIQATLEEFNESVEQCLAQENAKD